MVGEATAQVRALERPIASVLVIGNDEGYQAAADVLRDIQTTKRSVDNARKSVTEPLNAAKKAVQSMFSPLLKDLDDAREDIEDSMNKWEVFKEKEADKERDRERKKAEAQYKRLRTMANKKIANAGTREEARDIRDDMKASQEAALSVGAAKESLIDGEAPKVAGVGVREAWDFEVVDIDEVPRQWLRCEPKRREILKYADDQNGDDQPPVIPGIRFFKTKSRSVRSF